MNLIDDLNTSTTIPRANLTKLSNRVEWLICNAAYEASLTERKTTEVNMGFGKLRLKLDDGAIKYKFIPSKHLENMIITAYDEGIDQLAVEAEKAISGTILKAYKDLM